jgi:hypothetical protein
MSQVNNSKDSRGGMALNIGLLFLCIHLFAVHSKLLFHLNPDNTLNINVFDFTKLGVENVIAMVVSMSYSIMTVIIIKSIAMPFRERWNFAIIAFFGLMDGWGVFLYYVVLENYKVYASIYYAIYTFSIIAAFGLYQSFHKMTAEDELAEARRKVYNRKKQLGYDQEKIAQDPIVKELEEKVKVLVIK